MNILKSNLQPDILLGKVVDIAALKAIDISSATNYPNLTRAYIIGVGEYYLDKTSVASESSPNILVPTIGTGRWMKIADDNANNLFNKLGGAGWSSLEGSPEDNSALVTYVTGLIDDLIGGAPGALDTLSELADALNDDAAFATTVTNALTLKLNISDLINNLTSTATDKPLTAAQGKVLKDLIDALTTATSNGFTNNNKLLVSNTTTQKPTEAGNINYVSGTNALEVVGTSVAPKFNLKNDTLGVTATTDYAPKSGWSNLRTSNPIIASDFYNDLVGGVVTQLSGTQQLHTTTDGGLTWNLKTLYTTSGLTESIKYITATTIVATILNNGSQTQPNKITVINSFDGGATWNTTYKNTLVPYNYTTTAPGAGAVQLTIRSLELGAVLLSWAVGTGTFTTAYRVYRNSTLIASGTGTTYTDTSSTPGSRTYYVEVGSPTTSYDSSTSTYNNWHFTKVTSGANPPVTTELSQSPPYPLSLQVQQTTFPFLGAGYTLANSSNAPVILAAGTIVTINWTGSGLTVNNASIGASGTSTYTADGTSQFVLRAGTAAVTINSISIATISYVASNSPVITPLDYGTQHGYQVTKVTATNWFITGTTSGGTYTVFYKTTDSGLTWSFATIDAGLSEPNSSTKLYFIDSTTGYLLFTSAISGTALYKTTDGGSTWTQQKTWVAVLYFAVLNLYFINATTGFVVDPASGNLHKTTNSGSTFSTSLSSLVVTGLSGFGTNVYALSGSNVYRSADSGATWNIGYPVSVNATSLISNIQFVNASTGFIFYHDNVDNLNYVAKTITSAETSYQFRYYYGNDTTKKIALTVPLEPLFDDEAISRAKLISYVASQIAAMAVSTTYQSLKDLYDAGNLKPFAYYTITDHATSHVIPNNYVGSGVNMVYTAPTEALTIQALSSSKLDTRAYSTTFPTDIIYYDITSTLCEDGTTTRTGKITYRKDTTNNLETWYDWRNVRFLRWFQTATAWSGSSVAYSVGDVVLANSNYYKCHKAHTSSGSSFGTSANEFNWTSMLLSSEAINYRWNQTSLNIAGITLTASTGSTTIYNTFTDIPNTKNVSIASTEDSTYPYNNIIIQAQNANPVYNIKIGPRSKNCLLLSGCNNIETGGSFSNNIFGRNVSNSRFGNYFSNNIIAYNAFYNTFGHGCQHNLVGSSTAELTVESNSGSNVIGTSNDGTSFRVYLAAETTNTYIYPGQNRLRLLVAASASPYSITTKYSNTVIDMAAPDGSLWYKTIDNSGNLTTNKVV